jgi:hypothetical protein
MTPLALLSAPECKAIPPTAFVESKPLTPSISEFIIVKIKLEHQNPMLLREAREYISDIRTPSIYELPRLFVGPPLTDDTIVLETYKYTQGYSPEELKLYICCFDYRYFTFEWFSTLDMTNILSKFVYLCCEKRMKQTLKFFDEKVGGELDEYINDETWQYIVTKLRPCNMAVKRGSNLMKIRSLKLTCPTKLSMIINFISIIEGVFEMYLADGIPQQQMYSRSAIELYGTNENEFSYFDKCHEFTIYMPNIDFTILYVNEYDRTPNKELMMKSINHHVTLWALTDGKYSDGILSFMSRKALSAF